MATGLFLGAGASYEAGMPLVWDLTTELKRWLTPAKISELNRSWQQQGGGVAKPTLEYISQYLVMNDVHYEALIGSIDIGALRDPTRRSDYNFVYSKLLEIVYYILYIRHVKNPDYAISGLRFLEGMAGLAVREKPLWVFSLNHDLIVEMLAARYNLVCDAGFPEDITLPCRSRSGELIGNVDFEVLRGPAYAAEGLNFSRSGHINIIKLHGSLDVFLTNDGADFYKISAQNCDEREIVSRLRSTNEELIYIENGQFVPVNALNEIAYADEHGEMQFLRKSLLSGVRKFAPDNYQVIPKSILDQFIRYLRNVDHLIAIGYGFGDTHVNDVLRKWLEESAGRSIEIVAPRLTTCPPFLLHLRT